MNDEGVVYRATFLREYATDRQGIPRPRSKPVDRLCWERDELACLEQVGGFIDAASRF